MKQDNLNFILNDGQEPSNKRAKTEGVLSPQQRFVYVLREEFPKLTPKQRIILSNIAAELYCTVESVDHAQVVRYFDKMAAALEVFFTESQIESVARAYIEILGGGANLNGAVPLFDPNDPTGGNPAGVLKAIVEHTMAAPHITIDKDLGEGWEAAEFAIKSMTKGDASYQLFKFLELSHSGQILPAQVKWAIRGFMAGVHFVELNRPIPEPQFVWQQSFEHRLDVSNFINIAPDEAVSVYTRQLFPIHQIDQQRKCLAAYWRFSEIGQYVAQQFANEVQTLEETQNTKQ